MSLPVNLKKIPLLTQTTAPVQPTEQETRIVQLFLQKLNPTKEETQTYTFRQYLHKKFFEQMKEHEMFLPAEEWIRFRKVLKETKETGPSLSPEEWIRGIGYCLSGEVQKETKVHSVFPHPPKNPNDPLLHLFFLSKKHSFFSTPLKQILGQKPLPLSEEKQAIKIVSLHEKGVQPLARLVEHSFSQILGAIKNLESLKSSVEEGKNQKITAHAHRIFNLVKLPLLKQKTESLKRVHQRRMGYVNSLFKKILHSNSPSLSFIVLELVSSLKQLETAMETFIPSIRNLIIEFKDALPINEEKRRQLEEECSKRHQFDIDQITRQIEGKSGNFSQGSKTKKQVQHLLSTKGTQFVAFLKKAVEDNHDKEKDQSQTHFFSTSRNISSPQTTEAQKSVEKVWNQYTMIEDWLTACSSAGTTLLQFAREDLTASAVKLSSLAKKNQKSPYHWLETFNEHTLPKRKRKKKKTTTTQPISTMTTQTLTVPSALPLIKEEVQASTFDFLTSTNAWISSLLPHSILIPKNLNPYLKERINTSQTEAADRAFLSASAFELFFTGCKTGNLTLALSTIRSLIKNWHLQIEQCLFADHVLTTKNIPHHHHLVGSAKTSTVWNQLSQEEQALLQTLDYGLIWSRYPKASSEQYSTNEVLRQILFSDALLKKIQDGNNLSQNDLKQFNSLIQFVKKQQLCVCSFLVNRLKKRNIKQNTHLNLAFGNYTKALQELTKDIKINQTPTKKIPPNNPLLLALQTLQKKQKPSPYRLYLEEAEGHLRQMIATSDLSLSSEHLPWQTSQLMNIQWAAEQVYLYLCLSKGVGFILGHEFSAFQNALNDAIILSSSTSTNIKNTLDLFNFGIGTHYPHLMTTRGQSPSFENLKLFLHSLQQARITTQQFSDEKQTGTSKPLPLTLQIIDQGGEGLQQLINQI